MKKLLWIAAMLISGLFAVCMMQTSAIRASAAELEIRTEKMSEKDEEYQDQSQYFSDTNYYYYRAVVSIKNNTGIGVVGLQTFFDKSNFEVIFNKNNKILTNSLDVLEEITPVTSFGENLTKEKLEEIGIEIDIDDIRNLAIVGVAFNSKEDIYLDGDMYCFYLRAKKEKIDEKPELVEQMIKGFNVNLLTDSMTKPIEDIIPPEIVEVLYYTYLLGDVNGDGKVDNKDANAILHLLDKYTNLTIDSILNGLDTEMYGGLYVETTLNEIIFTLRPADVNGDGLINHADYELLFEYYAEVILAMNDPDAYDPINTEQNVYHEIEIPSSVTP